MTSKMRNGVLSTGSSQENVHSLASSEPNSETASRPAAAGEPSLSSRAAASSIVTSNARPATPPSSSTRRRKKHYAVSTQWERQVAEGTAPADIHSYFCCCADRIGHMFALLSFPDGTPIVVAGPCWPFCFLVTLPLILGVSAVVSYFMIISENQFGLVTLWILALYYPVLVFTLVALFCVSCRDPGLMERVTDEEAGEGGWFWNEQVGSFRPPGALYCRECGVLIQDYDHLCPWTGTGIGRNNMLAFKVFVVAVNVLCYFTIGIVIAALLQGVAA